MFATAEAEAKTYAGASAQLANEIGNLKEEYGAILAEAMLPFVEGAKGVVQSLAGMSDESKNAVVYTGLAAEGLFSLATAGGSAMATAGQMVIGYHALTASATGAKIAQLALNSAVGVGYVAAAAAAVGAGYALGASLQSLTETAQVNARVMNDLRSGTQAIAGVDFAGTAKEELDQYIASTQRQIDKVEQHNAALAKSQGWSNLWQHNKTLIEQNNKQIEALKENLNRAQIAATKGTEGIVVQQEMAAATKETTAAVREQILSVEEAGKAWDALNAPAPVVADPFGDVLRGADAAAVAIANSVDMLPDFDEFAATQDDDCKIGREHDEENP